MKDAEWEVGRHDPVWRVDDLADLQIQHRAVDRREELPIALNGVAITDGKERSRHLDRQEEPCAGIEVPNIDIPPEWAGRKHPVLPWRQRRDAHHATERLERDHDAGLQ